MPRPTLRMRLYLVAMLAACQYQSPDNGLPDGPTDGPVPLPDAGPCQAIGAPECFGDVLRTCVTINELPKDTDCGWGCDPQGTPHCLSIGPSGGAATKIDSFSATLAALGDVTTDGQIDTEAGTIDGAVAGTDFTVTNVGTVAVFHVKSLTVATPLQVRGSRSLVILAEKAITISAAIDLHGCSGNDGIRAPGPGGGAGGIQGSNAAPGGGAGGGLAVGNSKGGGGGGYGGTGGTGGVAGGAGGIVNGTPNLDALVGGSGGAGAKGAGGGVGGGGGGAIQLVSNSVITITATGSIDGGGCGGEGGDTGGSDGGGGGGSGGAILLEAPKITIDGSLAVNGGGGGGSDIGGNGGNGILGRVGGLAGTIGGADGGAGGAGGSGGLTTAVNGTNGGGVNLGAGGGGGAGRIRFNTRAMTDLDVNGTATLSPSLEDLTTCTQGLASIVQP